MAPLSQASAVSDNAFNRMTDRWVLIHNLASHRPPEGVCSSTDGLFITAALSSSGRADSSLCRSARRFKSGAHHASKHSKFMYDTSKPYMDHTKLIALKTRGRQLYLGVSRTVILRLAQYWLNLYRQSRLLLRDSLSDSSPRSFRGDRSSQ